MARAVVVLLILTLGVSAASANTRYDTRLRFRTISTARFDIHYHQGEEILAQRLARIAEEVASTLDRTLGRASGRVQVILVDQNDLPNGWATPVPYNTIEISAAAPTAESGIGNTDDWLRLVFIHEYTHIVHLSRSRGWIGGLRKVFGRLPVLFPNLFQPIWQIEGIATWQESAQTGGGRVPAGDFRLILERAAVEKRFDPLDRASSQIVDWPSGNTPYVYGAYFHHYLAETHGAEALRRLTDETAGRLPYLGSFAFKKVFDRSLGDLWKDFEASVQPPDAGGQVERLTRHGFYVTSPRFGPNGRLYYSLHDPHRFPTLRELDLATGESRVITTRYLGNRMGLTGPRLIFDQVEIVRSVGRQSDLYMVDAAAGDTRRLTYGVRAADPDVSPDGTTLVFTLQRPDRRELATAPLAPAFQFMPRSLASDADVSYASPQWSPDGKWIAAERRRRGGPSEIVVVDPASGAIRVVVAEGRNATPVWSLDGATIYFAAASEESAFQIFAVAAAGGEIRRLEGTGANAQSPAISPDGGSIVFVGYTAHGYDLFSLPLTKARWTLVPQPARTREVAPDAQEAAASPTHAYSPLPTLLPRFWTPTFESDGDEIVVGAATGGLDALARHAFAAEAGWSASRGRPDWQIAYGYDRWRPTFFVNVSDDTDPWREGERRTVEASAGILLPFRRVRWSQTVLAALHGSNETLTCDSGVTSCASSDAGRVRRESIRSGISIDWARMFGYSISPEEGGRVTATLESARGDSPDRATALSATIDARHYVRVWPRHAALALRAAAAASWGDEPVRRLFTAAGSDPQPGGFDFGTDAIGLMRGVEEDRLFGTRAAVVNLDYRFPILRVERGLGTLPFLFRAVHAAVFVDVGHAWSEHFRAADVTYSAGAEISADTVLGYYLPVTLSAGAAWRNGPDPDDRGVAVFARIGRAF